MFLSGKCFCCKSRKSGRVNLLLSESLFIISGSVNRFSMASNLKSAKQFSALTISADSSQLYHTELSLPGIVLTCKCEPDCCRGSVSREVENQNLRSFLPSYLQDWKTAISLHSSLLFKNQGDLEQ